MLSCVKLLLPTLVVHSGIMIQVELKQRVLNLTQAIEVIVKPVLLVTIALVSTPILHRFKYLNFAVSSNYCRE